MINMTQETVSVEAAAAYFNTNAAAIRKRIKRGTLAAVKDKAGRWQVSLTGQTGQDAGRAGTVLRDVPTGSKRDVPKDARRDALEAASAQLIDTLEDDNARLQAALKEVKSERDYLRERLAEAHQLLNQQQQLSLPKAKEIQALPAGDEDRRGWWGRLWKR
jgi:hypothetical protein